MTWHKDSYSNGFKKLSLSLKKIVKHYTWATNIYIHRHSTSKKAQRTGGSEYWTVFSKMFFFFLKIILYPLSEQSLLLVSVHEHKGVT